MLVVDRQEMVKMSLSCPEKVGMAAIAGGPVVGSRGAEGLERIRRGQQQQEGLCCRDKRGGGGHGGWRGLAGLGEQQ